MSEKLAIYLDANAGAPLHPRVKEALLPFFASTPSTARPLGNPSSTHTPGQHSKRLLREAQERILRSIGSKHPKNICALTSSGTEANQWAVRSALEPGLRQGKKPRWLTTSSEHDSILQLARDYSDRGVQVRLLPVTDQGQVCLEALASALTEAPDLVSLIWVNNETGVINDVKEALRLVRSRAPEAKFHLDAAQAWGKLPLELDSLGADYVSFSGHKIGALPGSGALWTREAKSLEPWLLGKQQQGLRGGTENLLGAIAMGAAASALEPLAYAEKLAPIRDRLQAEIRKQVPEVRVNGESSPRVANTLSLSFPGVQTDSLVMALDLEGYAVSAGSACSSGTLEPSHVLRAMGLSETLAKASIRISLPVGTRWEDVEGFPSALARVLSRARKSGARQESTA